MEEKQNQKPLRSIFFPQTSNDIDHNFPLFPLSFSFFRGNTKSEVFEIQKKREIAVDGWKLPLYPFSSHQSPSTLILNRTILQQGEMRSSGHSKLDLFSIVLVLFAAQYLQFLVVRKYSSRRHTLLHLSLSGIKIRAENSVLSILIYGFVLPFPICWSLSFCFSKYTCVGKMRTHLFPLTCEKELKSCQADSGDSVRSISSVKWEN